jgi:phosphomannomutase
VKPLKIGVSGVRGVVGETFTPELAVAFAQAFATYLDSGLILVCRDTRPSGLMVSSAVMAGLLASGCEVVDLGVCPTPSLQLAVPWLQARGGISITGGHNPAPWNALKFVRQDGLYLTTTQADELLDIYHQGEFDKIRWDRIQPSVGQRDAIRHHVERLGARFDHHGIRDRKLKVAVDCCNGSCSFLTPGWLRDLGCEALVINDDADAPFPHDPEPRIATMAQARALVKAGRADIGFVHDADGERLGIVDENAVPLSEELTLALATLITLQDRVGPVVTNVSTTSAIDRVAAGYGAPVVRTPVGQAYVSEAMIEHHAVIGGEGNGSVAVPDILASPDSAAAIGLVLEYLARSGEPVSALAARVPRMVMVKQQVAMEPRWIYSALQDFRDAVQDEPGVAIDLTDGVRVEWPDGWVHVRASNTESLIRVIAEAEAGSRANGLADWAREKLRR